MVVDQVGVFVFLDKSLWLNKCYFFTLSAIKMAATTVQWKHKQYWKADLFANVSMVDICQLIEPALMSLGPQKKLLPYCTLHILFFVLFCFKI